MSLGIASSKINIKNPDYYNPPEISSRLDLKMDKEIL
jgi:hypothetical protein